MSIGGDRGQSGVSALSEDTTAPTGFPDRDGSYARWTPFQRVLVRTDGTVTRTLQAFTGEDIKCVKLDQAFGAVGPERPLPSGDPGPERPEEHFLESDAGSTVIRRTILLRGARSLTNYVHATSTVMVDRLPVTMVYGMIYTSKPVGLLLAEEQMETTREILAAGETAAGPFGKFFGVEVDSRMIARTYRIVVGRLPALLITERFPMSLLREHGRVVAGVAAPGSDAGPR